MVKMKRGWQACARTGRNQENQRCGASRAAWCLTLCMNTTKVPSSSCRQCCSTTAYPPTKDVIQIDIRSCASLDRNLAFKIAMLCSNPSKKTTRGNARSTSA